MPLARWVVSQPAVVEFVRRARGSGVPSKWDIGARGGATLGLGKGRPTGAGIRPLHGGLPSRRGYRPRHVGARGALRAHMPALGVRAARADSLWPATHRPITAPHAPSLSRRVGTLARVM